MKWMLIIVLASALSLNGCASDASGDDSKDEVAVSTDVETVKEASSDIVWIAIVLTWQPVNRTIDKEFVSEVACWNYYENGVGEGKFGSQVLDHQGNPPDKGFHFGPDHLEYPIRIYRGKDGEGQVWLTCDIKGRYKIGRASCRERV